MSSVVKTYRVRIRKSQDYEVLVTCLESEIIEKVLDKAKYHKHLSSVGEPTIDLPTSWQIDEVAAPTITAKSIAEAFRKNQHVLVAHQVSGCCGQPDRLSISNEGVLLRQTLLALGFQEDEIERSMW